MVEVQTFIENKFLLNFENILQARLIKIVMTISALLGISRKAMTFINKRVVIIRKMIEQHHINSFTFTSKSTNL